MKIVLTTSLVAVLAIGLLGISNSGNNINNAFAQGDGIMGNDTGMNGKRYWNDYECNISICTRK